MNFHKLWLKFLFNNEQKNSAKHYNKQTECTGNDKSINALKQSHYSRVIVFHKVLAWENNPLLFFVYTKKF